MTRIAHARPQQKAKTDDPYLIYHYAKPLKGLMYLLMVLTQFIGEFFNGTSFGTQFN